MKVNELEKRANAANLKYRKSKRALILKVPTPILYTRKGLVAQKSTVDYTGLIEGGEYLAFDAKETQNKTSFPLRNIHQHQLNYLELVEDLGGTAFFLIHFKKLYKDKAYITPIHLVHRYWYREKRKSIPISEFKLEWLVSVDDYLKTILKHE
jgi:recombination protein U